MARIIEMKFDALIAEAFRRMVAFNKAHGCCVPAHTRPLTDAIAAAYRCQPEDKGAKVAALVATLDGFVPTDVMQRRLAAAARLACDLA